MYRRLTPILRNVKLQKSIQTPSFQNLAMIKGSISAVSFRSFSSEAPKDPIAEAPKESASNAINKYNSDDYDEFYEPQTKQEKVRYFTTIATRGFFLLLGVVLFGVTARELFPGRMSAQHMFSEVFDLLQMNDQVRQITGDDMRAFGRDTGRNTEGRRNHIDSFKYKGEDGSDRLRIRFNIKGNKGQVHVWVEVSDDMENDQYVYIVCQNARTGRVLTVVDNREELAAGFYAKKAESSFKFSLDGLKNLFK